jgi:FKBP-type peptidyl-prolyl cis-trans isomerase FkpA/FKBP-type peptidyl-prolyl cis-trans isomerase FklB
MKAAKLGLVALMVIGVGCQKKLDTDQKKVSYAIGQQIGQNIKQVGIEIDADVVGMAISDVLKDKNQMKPEEITEAQNKLQEMMMKKNQEQAAKNQQLAGENKKKADDFLAQNKSAAGVKTTPSGLQYIVVQEGNGPKPTEKDTVKVHYKGTLLDGTEFDSSYARNEPAQFPVNGVIKGWSEALQMMHSGGKYKLFVPPELAYGDKSGGKIPPNSLLVFDVELLDVTKGGAAGGKEPPKAKK